MGIFSKIPAGGLQNSWVLIQDSDAQFPQTGLKKTSLIRADKIATVSTSVFQRKLGNLSPNKQWVWLALDVKTRDTNSEKPCTKLSCSNYRYS